MHAYFDESGTHQGSEVMCVAGYLFAPTQARRFNREWDAVLRREGLKYFRKSECESGRGQFEGVPLARRITIQKELIELVGRRALFGGAAVMSQEEFDARAPSWWKPTLGSSYTACLHLCVAQVVEWLRRNKYPGPVAYFFESGHQKAHEADSSFNNIAAEASSRDGWMYASHTFTDKRLARPCDAADFLAWQIRHYYLESILTLGTTRRRPLRKDFAALLHGKLQRGLYRIWMMKDDALTNFFKSQAPQRDRE